MSSQQPALQALNIKKVYVRGSEEIAAVDGISLEVRKGEFVSFVGPSGSGKTTLINILGFLDNPTSGSLSLGERLVFKDNHRLTESELTRIRRQVFGYIFQRFYLIPTLTVEENIALPLAFYRKGGAAANIARVLKLMGLEGRSRHLPGQLSGGEMQRAAIARALVNVPDILLADEPTGNLDTKRSMEIGGILRELNQKEGLTILLVTHNPALAGMAHRVFELKDGRLK